MAFLMLKLNATTFAQTIKDDPEDRVSIEVGDSKQPDFKPQVKIMRWDNEVNFSLRAQEEVGAKLKELPDGTIVYEAKEYEVHQYDKPDASEEGGFEFEWVLKSKPTSNALAATIQTKGLSFYYQPPLTPEEIAEGAQRPENVEGSYAVYHSTKSNHKVGDKNYKAGKAFHIYRPKAIDANGVEQWCGLNIDETQGVLTVTVPQSFLDGAVYPVKVDPTFGYTTAGASTGQVSTSDAYNTNQFTISENGTAVSMSVRLSQVASQTPDIHLVVYSDNGSNYPSTKLDSSTQWTLTGGFNDWRTSNLNTGYSFVASTKYWLTYLAENTIANESNVNYFWDGADGVRYFLVAEGDSTPDATFAAGGTSSTRKVSIYATYTASGTSTFIPRRMMMGIG